MTTRVLRNVAVGVAVGALVLIGGETAASAWNHPTETTKPPTPTCTKPTSPSKTHTGTPTRTKTPTGTPTTETSSPTETKTTSPTQTPSTETTSPTESPSSTSSSSPETTTTAPSVAPAVVTTSAASFAVPTAVEAGVHTVPSHSGYRDELLAAIGGAAALTAGLGSGVVIVRKRRDARQRAH